MTNTFDEFVNKQNQLARDVKQSVDWDKEREEWFEYLEQFENLVVRFLQEHIEQNKVRLEHRKKSITEENIGVYEVRIITILIGNVKVDLEPIGTLLIGAKGRVDMKGPKGAVKIVLVAKEAKGANIRVRVLNDGEKEKQEKKAKEAIEWAWKISTPPPSIRYIELQKESFLTAIMEVVNG